MKIEKTKIVNALTTISKVVESRNTYPILANVHMYAQDGKLYVKGTDLDIEVISSCECDGDLNETTAPAKELLSIVRKLGTLVDISEDKGILTVSSGKARFTLPTLGADGFPSLQSGEYMHTTPEINLKKYIDEVSFAVSTEETRYYLNGVYLDGNNFVATDGHRLALVKSEHTLPNAILPRKLLALAPEGDVTLDLSTTKARLSYGDTVITSKLIEGSFPDYNRVIPQGNNIMVVANKKAMQEVVERVSVMASDNGGKAIKITFSGDKATFDVKSPQGEATDELELMQPVTNEVIIGFAYSYLIDALRAVKGDTVTMYLKTGGDPALFTTDDTSGDWLSVLMPMRV